VKGRLVRAENLIGGILTYARVGKEEQLQERFSVRELVEEVLENQPYRQGIRVNLSPALPVLQTERLPLFQVFSNLISNAFKYHNQDGGYVSIYYRDQGTCYEFFVEDDGPGIAPVYHGKIFQIFQTLQEKESFQSTGVGLAIVKKILDARHETIRLRSEAGKGTTFSFTWKKED